MDIKIEYEKDKFAISIKDSSGLDSILIDSVIKIIDKLKDSNTVSEQEPNNIIEMPTKQPEIKDKSMVRNRLPNEIDLSKYNIKNAKRSEPMIRCPNCGQASKVIVLNVDNQNYLMRVTHENHESHFELVISLSDEKINDICKPEDADIMDYHKDIMNIKASSKFKNLDLNVNGYTELLCPVCKEKHIFTEWTNAFQYPLQFNFETENLCEVCGGEMIEIVQKGKKIMKCESCGFEQPVVQ